SPGWRAASADAAFARNVVGARLATRADGPLDVGIGRFPRAQLRLTPRAALSAAGHVDAGRVVYPDAWPGGVDLVVTAEAHAIEAFLVLRDLGARDSAAAARRAFAWDAALPSGIARAAFEADGSLAFENAAGGAVLRVLPAYAVDAAGTRRAAH